MMADKYQRIHVTLSDGRRVTYAGRVQLDANAMEGVTVIGFEVSEPVDLPGNMRFAESDETVKRDVVAEIKEPGPKPVPTPPPPKTGKP